MEHELNNIVDVMTKEMSDICSKGDTKITLNIPYKLTPEEYMAITSIRRVPNPFKMIGINYVMKDLGICKNNAYKLFNRDDFPSVNVGKTHKVMILAYLMWKLGKRN